MVTMVMVCLGMIKTFTPLFKHESDGTNSPVGAVKLFKRKNLGNMMMRCISICFMSCHDSFLIIPHISDGFDRFLRTAAFVNVRVLIYIPSSFIFYSRWHTTVPTSTNVPKRFYISLSFFFTCWRRRSCAGGQSSGIKPGSHLLYSLYWRAEQRGVILNLLETFQTHISENGGSPSDSVN